MNTRTIGGKGEDIAVKYLRKQKYKIIDRNFRCNFGEIDVIARDGSYIVFVEVKSRRDTKFGMPREAVDARKQQTIVRCAKFWLTINNLVGSPTRFDVVEVLDGKTTLLTDAFRV